MVEGKWVAIIAAAAGIGGYYLAASQSGKRMCESGFSSHVTTFTSKCPTPPNTFDVMKYYSGL